MIEELFQLSRFYLRNNNQEYKRYFLTEHRLDGRFYIVTGQRGIGKTTTLVQYLMGYCGGDLLSRKVLYVPVDHTNVAPYSMYEIAEAFHKEGGEVLVFDEVHKYSRWSRELKSIYDVFPTIKILASGSSALEIYKSSHDLSRRAVAFRMVGLSFREFIGLRWNIQLDSSSLEEITSNHEHLASTIISTLETSNLKVLPLFRDYLRFGYYPYFIEHLNSIEEFLLKLEQDVRKTVESDSIAVFPKLSGSSVARILKLLSLVSQSVPYTPDLTDLKRKLEIGDLRTLKLYLKFLSDANVLLAISKKGRGLSQLEKPDKVYLDNTNLMHALTVGKEANQGSLRETFFANILSANHHVNTAPSADFLIDDSLTFEIGGKNKGARQVKGTANAYLALDDIETGHTNKIPLWLFGFLY